MSRKRITDTEMLARNEAIGSVLRDYRQRNELTQERCAREIQVTNRHYSAMELGKVMIYAVYLDILIDFLGIPHSAVWPKVGGGYPAFVRTVQRRGSSLVVYMTVGVEIPEHDMKLEIPEHDTKRE
ncbi:MAG TPA: helix-turn-helix transcriptional regulator [Chloroflexia bacterium]|jgi:transcriptional regulator with XRE-family HTH domain